jgi:1,4-dihydroxy-2-naphthoate octaprenyltransferase
MKKQKWLDILRSSEIFWYALIGISAVFILVSAVRAAFWGKTLMSLLMFLIFVRMAYDMRKKRTANKTIPEIYRQAKAGRKFAPKALEFAAIVAFNIAFWKTI